MIFEPLDDRVIIEQIEAEEVSSGGIILPDQAKQKPLRGKVVAVGPGKLVETLGERMKMSVEVGDEIVFAPYSGHKLEENRKEYITISEKDILAKVNRN
jgi:chaperonin GroES